MMFNATLNPDFVVQTLGSIVQAYASVLAIVGAFFIFLIERKQIEFRETEDKIDRKIDTIKSVIEEIGEPIPILRRDEIKEKGKEYLLDWWEKIKFDKFRVRMLNTEHFAELCDIIPKYQSLKKRTGAWVFRYFSRFFQFYAIMLILLIGLLYCISIWGINKIFVLAFSGFVGLSVLGIFLFVLLCANLVRME